MNWFLIFFSFVSGFVLCPVIKDFYFRTHLFRHIEYNLLVQAIKFKDYVIQHFIKHISHTFDNYPDFHIFEIRVYSDGKLMEVHDYMNHLSHDWNDFFNSYTNVDNLIFGIRYAYNSEYYRIMFKGRFNWIPFTLEYDEQIDEKNRTKYILCDELNDDELEELNEYLGPNGDFYNSIIETNWDWTIIFPEHEILNLINSDGDITKLTKI